MNKPTCRHFADAYEYTWDDLGISVMLDQLRESRGEIHCEIFVSNRVSGSNGTSVWHHMLWSTFNLSAQQTRSRLALTCHTKANVGGAELWQTMMEYVCLETMEQHRRGEPFLDLADGEAPSHVTYLVDPLLPKGEVTTVSADGDSGKSILALGVALSLVLGGQVVPGMTATEQCSVLYLDWETSYTENQRRQRLLCNGLGLHSRPSGIHYSHMTRSLVDDSRRIREFVDKNNVGLVIIDSAGPATGANLNDPEPVIAFMAAMRDLNATKLVLAHISKGAALNGGSERGRTFGSVFFENLSRSVWEVRSDTDSNPIDLAFFHRKANLGRKTRPFGLSLSFDDVVGSAIFRQADLSAMPALAEHAPLSIRVGAALRQGNMSTGELASELGVSRGSLSKSLYRDAKRNAVVKMPSSEKQGRGQESYWGLPADKDRGSSA